MSPDCETCCKKEVLFEPGIFHDSQNCTKENRAAMWCTGGPGKREVKRAGIGTDAHRMPLSQDGGSCAGNCLCVSHFVTAAGWEQRVSVRGEAALGLGAARSQTQNEFKFEKNKTSQSYDCDKAIDGWVAGCTVSNHGSEKAPKIVCGRPRPSLSLYADSFPSLCLCGTIYIYIYINTGLKISDFFH